MLLLALCFAGRALPEGRDSGDPELVSDAWRSSLLERQPPGTALARVCISHKLPDSADTAGFEKTAYVVHSFAYCSFAHPSIHRIVLNAYYVLGPVQTLGGVRMG